MKTEKKFSQSLGILFSGYMITFYIQNTQSDFLKVEIKRFNSHAGGMAVARPFGFEIDFVRNPISGSAA